MSVGASAAVLLATSVFISACVHVPLSGRASFRLEQYLSTHPELPPTILKAIQDGHVIAGMDREQVRAVLGTPLRTAVFRRDLVVALVVLLVLALALSSTMGGMMGRGGGWMWGVGMWVGGLAMLVFGAH